MLKIGRYFERECIYDNSSIASDFEKLLNNEKPNTVQSMVDDLAKRTGLYEYINQINAQLKEDVIYSLLDIKEVKEAVDEALEKKHYSSTVDLLKKLQEQIKFNSKIPEYLKNVFSDTKLKEYVDSKIKPKENTDKINLLVDEHKLEDSNQTHEPYFNFDNNENKK